MIRETVGTKELKKIIDELLIMSQLFVCLFFARLAIVLVCLLIVGRAGQLLDLLFHNQKCDDVDDDDDFRA
jgi:hypothetical protein